MTAWTWPDARGAEGERHLLMAPARRSRYPEADSPKAIRSVSRISVIVDAESGSGWKVFSVVIPTLGRPSLEDLLRSIPSSPLVVSVFVVGDAQIADDTADDLATKLAAWSTFCVKWVRAEAPGVNAARNSGIREAAADPRSQVVLLLDDDVVLPQSFRWEPLRDLYADPSILAVGGNYLSSPSSDFQSRGYNVLCSAWRVSSGLKNNEALLGGAWSIRLPEMMEVCRDLGWFEESNHYGGAETPFVHRLRRWAAGRRAIVWSAHMDVLHHPRNRRLVDWLRISALQNQRLDETSKAARPGLGVRLLRTGRFCLSLSAEDLVAFLAFAMPLAAAGRLAALCRTRPHTA